MRTRLAHVAAASVTLAISAVTPGLAHGHYDPGELGHHWNVPIYLSEMRFQLACMAVVTAAVFAVRLILEARKRCAQ